MSCKLMSFSNLAENSYSSWPCVSAKQYFLSNPFDQFFPIFLILFPHIYMLIITPLNTPGGLCRFLGFSPYPFLSFLIQCLMISSYLESSGLSAPYSQCKETISFLLFPLTAQVPGSSLKGASMLEQLLGSLSFCPIFQESVFFTHAQHSEMHCFMYFV